MSNITHSHKLEAIVSSSKFKKRSRGALLFALLLLATVGLVVWLFVARWYNAEPSPEVKTVDRPAPTLTAEQEKDATKVPAGTGVPDNIDNSNGWGR